MFAIISAASCLSGKFWTSYVLFVRTDRTLTRFAGPPLDAAYAIASPVPTTAAGIIVYKSGFVFTHPGHA